MLGKFRRLIWNRQPSTLKRKYGRSSPRKDQNTHPHTSRAISSGRTTARWCSGNAAGHYLYTSPKYIYLPSLYSLFGCSGHYADCSKLMRPITCSPSVETMHSESSRLLERVGASSTWPTMIGTWSKQSRRPKWKWASVYVSSLTKLFFLFFFMN